MSEIQNVTPATENETANSLNDVTPASETPISSNDVMYADTDQSVTDVLDSKADRLSPVLLGAPTAPTPASSDDSTRIATTAFVKNVRGVMTVNGLFPNENGDVQMTAGDVNAAPANHTHTGYAAASHIHENYAGINHTHANYADVGHTHSGFAAENHSHTDYAPAVHDHDEDYAALNHSHDDYAAEDHNHDEEYAALNHSHTEYAVQSHTHTGFAAETHTHTASDVGAAAANHEHTAADVGAAPASHTHAEYAAANHNHDADYADTDHEHTAADVGAAPANHTHTAADVGAATSGHTHTAAAVGAAAADHAHSNYATTGHDHDADYAPKSHTHDYAASGHTHTASAVGAAAANHTHTPASIGAAPATHSHDYAATDHTHTAAEVGAAASNHTHTTNVIVNQASAPSVKLGLPNSSAETRVYKNANASNDYGTFVADYSAAGTRDALIIRRGADLENKLNLSVANEDGSANTMYKLYGEHHKPTAEEVGAIPASGGTINGDVNVAGVLRVNGQQSFYFQTSTMSQTVGTNNATGGTTICCGANADVGVNGANMKAPNVLPRSNNAFTLGTSSVRWKGIYSTAAVNVSSDERMKRGIKELDAKALAAFVNGLNVVSYNYKDDETDRKARIGLIAQQVQKADPELARFFVNEDEGGMLNLTPADLVFPLIAAVQQLSARVAELEAAK